MPPCVDEYRVGDIVISDTNTVGPAANTRRRSLTTGNFPLNNNNNNIGVNVTKDITDGVRRAKELLNIGQQKNMVVVAGKENAPSAYPMPPPPPPVCGSGNVANNLNVAPVGLRKRTIGGVDSPSKRVRMAPPPTTMTSNAMMKPNIMMNMKPAVAGTNGPTFTYANQHRQPSNNMQAATALL